MTSSATAPLRRVVVATTIGSFSIAALLGVIALLGAGDFGETEARVLLTTVIVGLTSMAILCHLGTSGTPYAVVGATGGLSALVAAGVALKMTWVDDGGDGTWQLLGVAVVVALTLAQVSLLLGVAAERDEVVGLMWATILAASVAALIVVGMILAEDAGEGSLRLLGVVLILDVLGTVVTIALAAFGSHGRRNRPSSVPQPGNVVHLPGEMYRAVGVLARRSGLTTDQLVAEAVTQYLGTAIQESHARGRGSAAGVGNQS